MRSLTGSRGHVQIPTAAGATTLVNGFRLGQDLLMHDSKLSLVKVARYVTFTLTTLCVACTGGIK